jgi:hypothetical protein
MNTEFSFSGEDFRQTPIINHNGAVLPTQEDRARAYADYQRFSASHPGVVGTFWWSYFDPPSNGAMRGGEDANLGLVDNNDDPYGAVIYHMAYENRNVYTYRGLPVPQGPVLSGAFGQGLSETTFTNMAHPSIEEAPAAFNPSFFIYLPYLARNMLYRALAVTYSTSVATTQSSLTIFDGNGPHATQKRKNLFTIPLPAGTYTLTWDGLDQNGQPVADGWYYYLLKVTSTDGSTDYAIGRLGVGQNISDWSADFFRYDLYERMTSSGRYTQTLSVYNVGNQKWSVSQNSSKYRWITSTGQTVSEVRVALPYEVAPSSAIVITTTLQAPSPVGNYTLKWDMYRGETSFESLGGQPLQFSVAVSAP